MTIIFSNRENASKAENNLFKNNRAPDAIWPYSKARFAWDILFCSWQIWLYAKTMNLVEWGIDPETRQVCRNISYVLEDKWLSLKDVIKVTIFLKNMDDFDKVNEIYKDYFVLKPARSTVEVSRLPKNALVEIEVIAKKKSNENSQY